MRIEQKVSSQLMRIIYFAQIESVVSLAKYFRKATSVEIANIHRVKRPTLILCFCQIDATIHVLTEVASLDQVLDALAGMRVLVCIFGGGGELLL